MQPAVGVGAPQHEVGHPREQQAERADERHEVEVRRVTRLGLQMMLAVSLPLTGFMAVLSGPFVRALFRRGSFSAADAGAAGDGCARAWMDTHLRMNDIVTVGTHNSYKQAIDPKFFALVQKTAPKVAPSSPSSMPPPTTRHVSLSRRSSRTT